MHNPERQERRVMVGMPSYDGRLDMNTCLLAMGAHIECAKQGWGFALNPAVQVAPISVARSKICLEFLNSSATDLFFIDSDVSCDARLFTRMMLHPVDLVLGVYSERYVGGTYRCRHDKETLERDPDTGLMDIQGGPAGFMRIRRHVIQKMFDNLDYDDWFVVPQESLQIPMLFKPLHGRKWTCSEDMYFCQRWRDLGGKVWLDADLNLEHSGRATFSANFYKDYLTKHDLVAGV